MDAGLACQGVRSAEPIEEVGLSLGKCAEEGATKGRGARLWGEVSQRCDVEMETVVAVTAAALELHR
jgi:hypothetical protein